eukprot:18129_1
MPQSTRYPNTDGAKCDGDDYIINQFFAEQENCESLNATEFCPSYNFSYFYDNDDNDMYQTEVGRYSPDRCDDDGNFVYTSNIRKPILSTGPYDVSDTETYQHHRIAKFTFDLVIIIVDNLCNTIDACDKITCSGTIPCFVFKGIFEIIISIIDFVMGFADLHDGEINNMRLNAVFRDRITIIHNQKYLEHVINHTYDKLRHLIQEESLTSTQNVENVKFVVMKKLDEIHEDLTPGSPAKQESRVKLDDDQDVKKETHSRRIQGESEEIGLISINYKLRMMDVYLFVAVLFGWTVLFMIIGILIGKCVYGHKTNAGFAPVPKYDYSTSDVESRSVI